MLAEAFHYLTAPASLRARLRGRVGSAVALWSRAGRCRAAWEPHYAQCHAAVAETVGTLPDPAPDGRGRTVLVLGSGLAHDIPLDLLAERFERVLLVDAVHLWPVRLRTLLHPRRRRIVHLVRDLTGPDPAVSGAWQTWQTDPAIGLVISANVLSQLPLGKANADRRPALVVSHLDALGRFPDSCPVLLLTDIGMIRRAPDGTILKRSDLLFGIPLPPSTWSREWDWTVCPFGEESSRHERIHHAGAWRLR
ncbi:hypothetical protein SAMN05444156_0466 [Verrucomicrobium sp. GAS474]|uniref:hypothetical protein n=1 Tax=Verrucomicrobium sp. GAS474 TaxID=1882831 RepID=UPI00087CAC13|nr:hypothetical protein [Verrucomicrobium sp. GAS474]SDT89009.1 hypothetical protein SAMN05444156_0466 [Verrucomicrobium sp. GAS474]